MEHTTIGDRILKIRENENISSRKMALAIGIDPSQFLKIEKGLLNLPNDKVAVICSTWNVEPAWLLTGEGSMKKKTDSEDSTSNPGDVLRRKKAIEPTEDKGLYYVPIAAQAGYALHYDQPMYLKDLERLYIPGNPFKGDRFRYFEVEGDSMYPTLIEGMQVIAQKIEKDYWNQIQDYYIHVIVTQDRILIKRLVRFDSETLVMISDNEELYSQKELKYTEVKELWLVKRSLDWRLPPPKTFEITINKDRKDKTK